MSVLDGVSETRDGRREEVGKYTSCAAHLLGVLREAEAGMAVAVKERGVGARTESEGNCHETGKRKASRTCPARKTTSTSRYRYYNTDQESRLMNRIDHQSFCREIDLLIVSSILHTKQKYRSGVLTPRYERIRSTFVTQSRIVIHDLGRAL
jgi:hypothetical protein